MYLKTSNKKQLAAAVTLAVMGTAWVAVPGQVWAADGGSQDHPRQYSSYTADSDRAIAIAREQKTGEDMYAAQYHENFADLAFRAKDDMGGKTITLKSMTVEGIIGADGKGAAAGLPVEESTAGKNGGIGSAVGIYSTNILNANITFGDIAIKAIGGNTYSQEITSGKYTHEGKAGVDGESDKNLNGGAGANGGNGGLAIATGVDITGSNNTATGGVLTVTATGSDGGHGGYGGVGGTAAAITTVPAKAGDGAQGADGADSTTSGTTPSTAGANGTIGGAGGAGLAGADGTAGTVGAVGLTGGIGGNGSNGGSGSNAEATGLKIAGSGTATTISLGGLVVEAAAGNGGAGGAGGAGGIGGVGGTGGIGGNGGAGGDGGDGAQGGQGAQGAGGSNAHHSTGSGDNDVEGTAGGNGGNGGQGGAAGAGGNGGIGGNGGTGGTGGHGGNGGVGGNATALGFAGTDSIINLAVAGNGIAVTATGGDGAKAGIGGAGGIGGFGGNGGVGGDGGDYGDAGKGGHGGAGGAGGQGGILLNGNIAVQGSQGVQGGEGAAAANGTVGTGGNAGQGGTGGTGGNAGNAGISQVGGSATSTALTFTQSQVNLQTTAIKATAIAGKGVGSFDSSKAYEAASGTANVNNTGTAGSAGTTAVGQNGAVNTTSNGGAGGSGITPTGTIAQTGNGEKAIAAGLVTTNGTLNVVSDAGLAISAEAKGAAVTNNAVAVEATDSNNIYAVTGDFTVNAAATADVDLTKDAANSNLKFEYKADKTSTTSIAKAFVINGGSMLADIDGKLEIEAAADKGEAKNWAQGMAVDNTTVQVHTTDAISIKATAATGAWQGAQGIEGNNNDLTFVSDAGGIKVTALGGNSTNLQKEYAVWLYDSSLTLDAKDAEAGIELNGDVEVVTNKTSNSTLNLKSNTKVNGNASDIGGSSKGTLNITGTTMNLTDNLKTLTVADKTTLKGSTVYFYDENNQADKYNTADYRTITTNDLDAFGTNELFMRTNANGVYGQSAGNDKIISTNTATGKGTYNITVFDQGMRNGYNNAAGADTKGHLDQDVVLIENADKGGTYNIKEMKYDNGVWAYEYEGKAEVVDDGLNLTQVTTRAATQSSAQMAAQDANKVAAGAAVTLFGADETLMERLGDVRNSADDNDGVWAKYVGGKIKVDGLQGDNDYQYNGFAAGYDREIGSNWRIGLAGQYAKGDTSLTNGDGEIKTAAGALYGTWSGDKGHHVDIIAKVGKVDSETSAYGGTIAQKLDGDFGSTAISFAVEYGYRQDLNDGWFVEPMVRASYVHLGGDDYTVTTRDNTMSVTNDSMNSIVLRGGFLLGKTFAADSSVYLKAAVLHDFDGDINTHVSADGRSASYSDSIGGTAIEYGIGVNHKFNKDSSMYLDVERISGGDVTKNWGVNVGFRYSF